MRTRMNRVGLLAVGLLAGVWAACSSSDSSSGGGGSAAGTTHQGGQGAQGAGGGDGGLNIGGMNQGGGISGCDPQTFTLLQAPPAEVYLVIDRSGSMNEPGSNPSLSKWQELNEAVDLALSQYEGAVQFGVLMYPTGEECATSGPQVAPALGNRLGILHALGTAVPAGGTPTAAALNNASDSLGSINAPDSPKFLVLATDGGPNCNYGLSANPSCSCSSAAADACCTNAPSPCYFGQSCLDDQKTLAVITALHTQGIDTFVIGLQGSAQYENLLNLMAQAGGRPKQGGATSYYPANNPVDLQAALQTIAVSVISCQIDLGQAPDYPEGVLVYVDGNAVGRDTNKQNGWDYTDNTLTMIELYGTACDTLQDGTEHHVTATFQCQVR